MNKTFKATTYTKFLDIKYKFYGPGPCDDLIETNY